MNKQTKIDLFWQSYLATLSEVERSKRLSYAVDQFADTPEAATKVGKLVRDGVKTITSSLVWGLEQIGEPLPNVGKIELIVDGNGEPLCITELTELDVHKLITAGKFGQKINVDARNAVINIRRG